MCYVIILGWFIDIRHLYSNISRGTFFIKTEFKQIFLLLLLIWYILCENDLFRLKKFHKAIIDGKRFNQFSCAQMSSFICISCVRNDVVAFCWKMAFMMWWHSAERWHSWCGGILLKDGIHDVVAFCCTIRAGGLKWYTTVIPQPLKLHRRGE